MYVNNKNSKKSKKKLNLYVHPKKILNIPLKTQTCYNRVGSNMEKLGWLTWQKKLIHK